MRQSLTYELGIAEEEGEGEVGRNGRKGRKVGVGWVDEEEICCYQGV